MRLRFPGIWDEGTPLPQLPVGLEQNHLVGSGLESPQTLGLLFLTQKSGSCWHGHLTVLKSGSAQDRNTKGKKVGLWVAAQLTLGFAAYC